jgi:hypothetical protein
MGLTLVFLIGALLNLNIGSKIGTVALSDKLDAQAANP